MTIGNNNWESLTLGDLGKWITGSTPPSSDSASRGEDVLFVTPTDIGYGGKLGAVSRRISNAGADRVRRIRPGSVILVCIGTIGKVAWTDQEITTNQQINVLEVDIARHDIKFIHWLLASPQIQEQLWANSTSTTVALLNKRTLEKIPVQVPRLEEQKRIVAALDSQLSRLEVVAGELSQTSVKSSHLLMTTLEDAISECESTTRQPLRDFLEILGSRTNVQRGWSPQCLSHPQSDPENWAVLKTTAVQNMSYEPQHNKELPKTLTPKTNLEVRNGDFLMTTTGPRNRCGVVCYVRETPEKLIFSGKILRFRPNQDVLLPEWLESVLASPTYQALLNDLKVGSSDSSVSIGNAQILDLAVPVPSIPKQIELVERIGKIKEISKSFEVSISESIEQLGVLRRSILHAAFSGQSGQEN